MKTQYLMKDQVLDSITSAIIDTINPFLNSLIDSFPVYLNLSWDSLTVHLCMMSLGDRFLFKNGFVVSLAAEAPSVTSFLEFHPGAYTTTRTHNNGTELLFWKRHLDRLSNSLKLLLKENPKLLFQKPGNVSDTVWELSTGEFIWDSVVRSLVNDSIEKIIPFVVKEGTLWKELAITILLSGNLENVNHLDEVVDEAGISEVLDVYMHLGGYLPPVVGARDNSARLALVGRGRDFANAKYSDWVRLRKRLEKLRPPSVTELLLSNDGDRILEGCLSNFFVVSLKEKVPDGYFSEHNDLDCLRYIEIQSAPTLDGVLPGVIRQVIKEICFKIGIPFREVAPSWSLRELWVEAFITNSLRILQHVETIQTPCLWETIESNSWEEISWMEKQFEGCPGRITSMLQREIMKAAGAEALAITSLTEG